MSEYGIKIKNYQAGSLYEYQYGFRQSPESTDAMLTNSLFLDFLLENGLNVHNEESTRDVICLEFGYKTKGYQELKDRTQSMIEKHPDIPQLQTQLQAIEDNKEFAVEISKSDLRTKFYTEGIQITYRSYAKNGSELTTKRKTIKYKMLYRTPGKAKKGTCMFINEKLYKKAHEFLYMGIKLPKEKAPIVEIGAYSSLITSSIIGKIQIRPEEMLILKDIPTVFKTSAILVQTNDKKECYTEKHDEYDLTGEAFDGQALIDSSIFPDWADGYVLLRHHMTKCAAFCTYIQKFMQDYYGDFYETATITDMFDREVRVKDIKLITTKNAIKWTKFGVSVDYWFDWVRKNDCMFGVVKTSHPSKFGDVQRMSYQMTNSLDIDSMDSVMAKSIDYIEKLKSNDESYFLDHLRKNVNFSNDYDVLLALVEHDPEFVRSEYYRERKNIIIGAYVLDFKSGRVMQNADNLTIVGSPYAMLLHSVGEDPRTDPTFSQEEGTIQCWCSKFDDGEYLAEFRSPFNSRNNLGYIHNTYHEYFDKYFNLGGLCLAVNTMDTDWQARNNGADQDSDSCYTTNQPDIVRHAKFCYDNYPTVVNAIPPDKNIYNSSLECYAAVDNTLMESQLAIGQSSNLAQLALTYTYNFDDPKYNDYACILAVLAQVAIDNAKRHFDIDLNDEIRRIKTELNVDKNGLPYFWEITKKDKRKVRTDSERVERQRENKKKIRKNINKTLICPMNELYRQKLNYERDEASTLTMDYFFVPHEQTEQHRKSKAVEELIENYSLELYRIKRDLGEDNWKEDDSILLMRNDFDKLISDIQKVYISKNYLGLMSYLINRAFLIGAGVKSKVDIMDSSTRKNKALLMKVLYSINPEMFLECFKTEEKVTND